MPYPFRIRLALACATNLKTVPVGLMSFTAQFTAD
jgi:hypothetical protein